MLNTILMWACLLLAALLTLDALDFRSLVCTQAPEPGSPGNRKPRRRSRPKYLAKRKASFR